jgi:3-deoxy-7-phosphoheptulonate synthase
VIPEDRSQLRYGVSVTDPCIDWKSTEDLLRRAHRDLAAILKQRN